MNDLKTRLLSKPDVEKMLVHGIDDNFEEIMIMTIMEPLFILEDVKKKGQPFDLDNFRSKWAAFLKNGTVYIAALDQNSLLHGLFDSDYDQRENVRLWEGVQNCNISPDRTVRRIVLRPNETNWWENDLLQIMEDWFE